MRDLIGGLPARGRLAALIAGDRRLTRPLVDALPNGLGQHAVLDSRHLTEVDGPVLAIAVAERLARERAERHLALVRRVRDAALGAGRGALGSLRGAVSSHRRTTRESQRLAD